MALNGVSTVSCYAKISAVFTIKNYVGPVAQLVRAVDS